MGQSRGCGHHAYAFGRCGIPDDHSNEEHGFYTMKMQKRREKGFTLLEVIITFTLIAIVGTMLYTYLGTSMTKSSVPLSRLQMSLSLQQIMENITADYPKNYAFDLPALQAAIGGEGTNQDNDYGQYAVFENHF